ncbi:DNA-binding protein [Thermococcus guaymasensis DSM 11113]|uniref:DNA-binding protein n=1 Tax=Thermococcus guaymasensis DSM 11113 TaxID=1432656 RepID=A0A0X1KJT4_9EURY|nr:OB-fold nucleic acid binding domain-containing protein [Thermococcus guaymasensis]AJC71516.1 DNA-binding protein [Thermococcus guaymasensis DSM 11113]
MVSNSSRGNDNSKEEQKRLYYHGLKEQKKIDVSRLKYISLIIAVLGVALILIAAQGAQAPLMKVNDVYGNYLMNYAVVRINGTVVTVPYVSQSGGKLTVTFTVDDGTGQIDVRVYSPLADEMLEKGVIPFPGDNVTAEVQLRVRETYTYSMLQYLEGLRFNSKLYSENPQVVKSLTTDMANTYVAVEGIVTEFSNVSSGYLLTVDTGESEVTVLVPKVLLVFNDFNVKVGDMIYAPGIVYLYKGTSPEIVVRNLSQVSVTPIEEAPLVQISEAHGYPGMVMAVKGSLAGITYESGRYVVTLTDGQNYLDAVVPREILANLDPFRVSSESTIKVAGKMGDDGRLVAAYLAVVEPVETEFRPIGTLTSDMLGSIVAVRGNIAEVVRIGSNLKLVIDDGTGKIDVFIPSATLAEISNETMDKLKDGLGVEVGGYLEEYRGALEVVVYTGSGIRALGEPVPPQTIELPKVNASQLADYKGQLVEFVGSLESITYVDGTYYLTVDGVKVSLSRDALLNLNPIEAGTGSQVVVKGLVVNESLVKGENLTVEVPVAPVPLKPDEVTTEMEGQLVVVVGKVTDVANLSGNLKITIGSLPIFVPRTTANELAYVPAEGDLVQVGGYVEIYQGEPEVVLFHPLAVEKLQQSGPVEGTVSDLETAVEPLLLTVTWDSIAYQGPDYALTVSDSTGSTTLLAERSLLLNPLEAGTGSTLKIVADPLSGRITQLEVSKAKPSPLLSTGAVDLSMKGKTVAVNGTVVDVAVIGSSLKLRVDDGSGEITVFIPGGADLSVEEGQSVLLAGYVDEYNGEVEIVVYDLNAVVVSEKPSGGSAETNEVKVAELSSATGVVNLTVVWDGLSYNNGYVMKVHDDSGSAELPVPRELLPDPREAGSGSTLRITYDADAKKVVSITVVEAVPAEELKTGKVTLDLLGKTVVVEGTVKDVYVGSSFIKLTVDDGSGELVVFIPKSVAGDMSFEKGQTVRVAGYVSEYKGTVEVIPYRTDCIEVR